MYTVFAERYRDDRNTQMHTLTFDTLEAVQGWMRDHANPSSGSFLLPTEEARRKFADPRSIRLGWLPGGHEWWVLKIDNGSGTIFSDGSLTRGEPFIAASIQGMLERLWAECKNPESRFVEEGAVPVQAVIPAADAAAFRSQIDPMKAIFADERRSDWFDADDIAREIAEALDLLLAGQGL